jgi:hypothetical protein
LFVAPGTTGNVLTSNGTTWASTTPSGGSTLTISNKTGAYTVVAGDAGTVIDCTSGTFTVSLTAAATLGSGFNVTIWNTSATATDVITIDPAGAETIDGRTTLVLRRGEGMQIVCDGTNWQTGDKKVMRGYAENYASGVARGSVSGSGSIALGPGTASGDFSFAVGLNANASGARSIALANANSGLTTASGSNSTAIGANSNGSGSQAGTGAGAMALGGSYASGADSFAAAIANNTSSYGATGGNSIAMGSLAKSTADGLALGGLALSTNSNIAISSAALRGLGATASSNGGCIAIGGNVTASAFSSVAIGQDAVSSDSGKFVFSPVRLAVNGDAQTGTKVVSASTTNATPKALSMGDFGATYQVILPNNSAYAFSGTIVARQQAADGTASAAWKVEGLIRREANAASTTLVASTVTDISNVPVWVIALTADTTNGGLAVTATGAAATDIRWVATIQTSEVTYA